MTDEISPRAGLTRRALLASLAAAGALRPGAAPAGAQPQGLLKRAIPSTGEMIPAVGMGSWITFNVGSNEKLRRRRLQVLQTFFDRGGALIDLSPMYGTSEAVIGHCLARTANKQALFSATKVWTMTRTLGISQMEELEKLWGEDRFDLMQVHNLLDRDTHLETLKEWKAAGRIRYIGVTTSHGRRHGELEEIMKSQPLDFVQFTYNILDREAEKRLLPLAADKGLAVIVNRPFQRNGLFRAFGAKPLPPWAGEVGCANWAQFFLKFILSHPAVACAIPATSQVPHMEENMGALSGPLPDAELRARMVRYVESI